MYLNYFNLAKEPFVITPNTEFIYFSNTHTEAYQMLIYGIENRKGFMLLTGPVGVGKTSLCRLLLDKYQQQTQENGVKIAYIFNPTLNFNELLINILNDLGARYNKKKELTKVYLLEVLNNFLIKHYSKKNIVTVIIDEAQLLEMETLEEIRLLTNLETNNHKLLQIILCGQPELDEIIDYPRLAQLKQRINLHAKLEHLNYKETINYINHRLKIAGAVEPANFSKTAKMFIYKYSRGIPRLINSVCDKSFIAAYALNKNKIDSNCVYQGIKVIDKKSNIRLLTAVFFRKNLIIILFILILMAFVVLWWKNAADFYILKLNHFIGK